MHLNPDQAQRCLTLLYRTRTSVSTLYGHKTYHVETPFCFVFNLMIKKNLIKQNFKFKNCVFQRKIMQRKDIRKLGTPSKYYEVARKPLVLKYKNHFDEGKVILHVCELRSIFIIT